MFNLKTKNLSLNIISVTHYDSLLIYSIIFYIYTTYEKLYM